MVGHRQVRVDKKKISSIPASHRIPSNQILNGIEYVCTFIQSLHLQESLLRSLRICRVFIDYCARLDPTFSLTS